MVILEESSKTIDEICLSRENLVNNDFMVIVIEDKKGRINEVLLNIKDIKNIELSFIKHQDRG